MLRPMNGRLFFACALSLACVVTTGCKKDDKGEGDAAADAAGDATVADAAADAADAAVDAADAATAPLTTRRPSRRARSRSPIRRSARSLAARRLGTLRPRPVSRSSAPPPAERSDALTLL